VLGPTSRLLTVLELLQARPAVTGREIAGRLGVDSRTVRRYVAALQDLGIPVEGQRGVGGGYRMRPGYRLPPLMLSDDEAVVVVIGLAAARRLGLDSATAGIDGAQSKVLRVLPAGLRRRVDALEAAIGFTAAQTAGAPVAGETVLALADAARRGVRVRCSYRTHPGRPSRRRLSPYGLVVHSGRWYLAAHDHDRGELRTFRVDRIRDLRVSADEALPAPEGFDAVAHVSRSLARVPWEWDVEVVLDLPLAAASARIPATLAELSDAGGRTSLRMRVGSLDWTAGLLAGLGCPFTVCRPEELRSSIRALAERLAASAGAATPPASPSG
jgi:predicted DNA-binding transcriptional regulator YafY